MSGALSTDWLRVLACPRCGARLEPLPRAEPGMVCAAACGGSYPMVGRVPCLVPDPMLWRAVWLSRFDEHQQVTQERIRFMQEETHLPQLLPRTRARLENIIAAKAHERRTFAELFAELRQGALFLPSAGVPPIPENLGGRLSLLEWYENLFRDWAWGGPESERLCQLITGAAAAGGDDPAEADAGASAGAGAGAGATRAKSRARKPATRPAPECLAVYGAGAGRLAYDVHRALNPGRTIALDLNPLPLLVADRVVRGETIELFEFPVAPTTAEQMTVRQSLTAPVPVDDRLCFAFADAYQPPLATGAVDMVLTPWFIDIAGPDVPETAAALARVLRPGGRWINIGPLHFNTVLSRSYLFDEVLELVERSGFALLAHGQELLPYFDSPVSGARRQETIYWFAAERTANAPLAAPPRPSGPPWLNDLTLPVPRTQQVADMARTSGFTAMALSLIDGNRSIADIAGELSMMSGAQPAAMVAELRAFLAKLAGQTSPR